MVLITSHCRKYQFYLINLIFTQYDWLRYLLWTMFVIWLIFVLPASQLKCRLRPISIILAVFCPPECPRYATHRYIFHARQRIHDSIFSTQPKNYFLSLSYPVETSRAIYGSTWHRSAKLPSFIRNSGIQIQIKSFPSCQYTGDHIVSRIDRLKSIACRSHFQSVSVSSRFSDGMPVPIQSAHVGDDLSIFEPGSWNRIARKTHMLAFWRCVILWAF